MDFYVLGVNKYYIDKDYAYAMPIDASYSDKVGAVCPMCGITLGKLIWKKPIKIELSKPSFGDIMYGNDFFVSEKFVELFKKSNITGIVDFIEVDEIVVKKNKKKLVPPKYYKPLISRSAIKLNLKECTYVDSGKEYDIGCDLCNPTKLMVYEILKETFEESTWDNLDIFNTYYNGDIIYSSQRFVDFCKENNITNLMPTNMKDYQVRMSIM